MSATDGPAPHPLIPFAFTVFLAVSCGGGDSNPHGASSGASSEAFFAALPPLIGTHLVRGGELRAEVTVDDGEPLALEVDEDNRQASGRIQGLSPGPHVFTVYYFINGVLVAVGTEAAMVQTGAGVAVTFSTIRYPDGDGDGFSNLAELEIFGLDSLAWNDPALRPASELPRFSRSYTLSDTAGVPFTSASRSQSLHYTLRTETAAWNASH